MATPVLAVVAEVLGDVRRAKTTAKRSMRSRVARLEVVDGQSVLDAVASAHTDLEDAGGIDDLVLTVGDPRRVEIALSED